MVQSGKEGEEVRRTMRDVGDGVWRWLINRSAGEFGTRG